MKSEKTKDQAQSGTEQSKIPAPDLAQQIYPTATVGRGANQPADPSAAMTIDKTTIKETKKAVTAKREQKDWNKRIRLLQILVYYFRFVCCSCDDCFTVLSTG